MTGNNFDAGPGAVVGGNNQHDLTGSVLGQVMGPNRLGEYVTAVTAEYDSVTDSTRVGFRYATQPDIERHMADLMGLPAALLSAPTLDPQGTPDG